MIILFWNFIWHSVHDSVFDVYKNKKMPKTNPLKLINWVENGFITMKRMCNSGAKTVKQTTNQQL